MDWLSRLLESSPVHGRLELRCTFDAPWRIEQPPAETGDMPYHVVMSGSAMLEHPAGGAPIQLNAGDILLFSRGSAHVLHDGSGLPAAPVRRREAGTIIINENTGTDERLDMLCGRFTVAPTHERLLRNNLPEWLIIRSSPRADDDSGEAPSELKALVALMRAATGFEGLGSRALLDALSTALFTAMWRQASEWGESPVGLLSLASYPRLIPVLEAMFQEPAHPWTLSTLAQMCHMSRATFMRLFQEKLGRSANDLLTDIRMARAASELRKSNIGVAAVASMVGYQSEAAFQRAFKQHMGETPGRWRRLV
jgi:AraC family transcriptional activator of mtrCDE